jgi:hypothetical protein
VLLNLALFRRGDGFRDEIYVDTSTHAVREPHTITELDISSNMLGWKAPHEGPDMSGVIALGNALPDMGALITLNMSSNGIPSEQIGGAQRICAAGGIEIAI